jgi:hypothetical protein
MTYNLNNINNINNTDNHALQIKSKNCFDFGFRCQYWDRNKRKLLKLHKLQNIAKYCQIILEMKHSNSWLCRGISIWYSEKFLWFLNRFRQWIQMGLLSRKLLSQKILWEFQTVKLFKTMNISKNRIDNHRIVRNIWVSLASTWWRTFSNWQSEEDLLEIHFETLNLDVATFY